MQPQINSKEKKKVEEFPPTGWALIKDLRQQILQRRKDEMILAARRRMKEKDEEGAAHDMCDKRHDRYLGAFFRKRWKGIYSFLNMNLLTTDPLPYRHLHHLFLHTYFHALLLLAPSSPALLKHQFSQPPPPRG
jgi:hypothetical protein